MGLGLPGLRRTCRPGSFRTLLTRREPPRRSGLLNSISTPYNRGLHLFAVITACATFLLIAAGALVTSNDAGLSVPDWPTSFGRSPITYQYFEVPMVGGVKYEHGHRMFAELVGIMTIVLAVWVWRRDRRRSMRWLSIAALALVVLQGVAGGVSVLNGIAGDVTLRMLFATSHAAMGQAFFCIAACMAMLTGRRWLRGQPQAIQYPSGLSMSALAWSSVLLVYIQLILGAMFRHHGMRLLPHVIMASVVTIVLLSTVLRTLAQYVEVEPLRKPAVLLLGLLVVQLALGFAAYLTRVVWSQGAAVPTGALVASTVAHVSVGALVLATTVVLAVNANRYIARSREELVSGTEEAAAA